MKKLLIAASVLTLCAAPAIAADMMKNDMAKGDVDSQAQMMTDMGMKMMDTNGDGMVSKNEHNAAGEKMFMMADTNKDGSVSKMEMMDMKKKELMDMHGGMSDDKMMMKK